MEPQVTWHKQTGQYQNGYDAKVGKWKVGSVSYSSAVSRGDPKKQQTLCLLPGIKKDLGRFKYESEARQRLEHAIATWFNGLDKEA